MSKDYAKKSNAGRKKAPARKKQPARSAPPKSQGSSGWRWYSAGVLTGVFLSFLVYLGTLPPTDIQNPGAGADQASTEPEAPPKPRFDFYTMLSEESQDEDTPTAAPARPTANAVPSEYYLLQAGSFRQQDDADRRRAELLLLGLEPSVEESTGENGRWFRVYLGPFQNRSSMSKARSLTAAQNIDTLLLKRSG
ncbi:MAG: SPOR domain-containing protein [Halioglobus sp.]